MLFLLMVSIETVYIMTLEKFRPTSPGVLTSPGATSLEEGNILNRILLIN